MLVLLSPAKSLDFTSRPVTRKHTMPRLLDRSEELIEVLRTKSPDELARLMKISDDLAVLNAARYRDFETPFTPGNARAAILAFNGDVYRGMAAASRFGERDFGKQHKRLPPGFDRRGDRPHIDFGLARTGDAVEQQRFEFRGGDRLAQLPRRRRLFVGRSGGANAGSGSG